MFLWFPAKRFLEFLVVVGVVVVLCCVVLSALTVGRRLQTSFSPATTHHATHRLCHVEPITGLARNCHPLVCPEQTFATVSFRGLLLFSWSQISLIDFDTDRHGQHI